MLSTKREPGKSPDYIITEVCVITNFISAENYSAKG